MTIQAEIQLNQPKFFVGDTVTGTAFLTLPTNLPLSNVILSFHCLGEVKWIEYSGSPYYLGGRVNYEDFNYFQQVLDYSENDVKVEQNDDSKIATIPFSFTIPNDKNLPSTMLSNHGFIQYSIRVTVNQVPPKSETQKFIKELIVQSPIEDNLAVTVGASLEKLVILHGGKVSMHACIYPKGFAPGETVTVHVAVDNKTNARLNPRVSLHQDQIYKCGSWHKTIENHLTDEPIMGAQIEPYSETEQKIQLKVPLNEALSIKSTLITIKYSVHVTLGIPHSLDLHVKLPIVLTARNIIDKQQQLDQTN